MKIIYCGVKIMRQYQFEHLENMNNMQEGFLVYAESRLGRMLEKIVIVFF
jgi:hypothetical protein